MEQSTVVLDEKSFWEKYWFDNAVHVTVANPLTEDFKFEMVVQIGLDRSTGKPREEHRTFMVPAGGKERYVGSVANLYLDKMAKRVSQDAGRFGDMSDWNAKAKYYDDLIVGIDDPFADSQFVPYEEHTMASHVPQVAAEVPFAAAAAQDEEKQRLERENQELRDKLAAMEPITSVGTTVPLAVPAAEQPQPFAEVIAKAPKRMGRPPKKRR